MVCTWAGGESGLLGLAEELLTLGRELAASAGADLVWLALGTLPDGAAVLLEISPFDLDRARIAAVLDGPAPSPA